ncbi:MAG: A/G-specific adenine glycosylase [Lachnospiraceae bacterium]|nr:A/G-specific adenine glycosylase [Lachnospiraceae bacterium]
MEIQTTEINPERSECRKLYAETIPYLLHWYEYNRRILPWREEPTPYHVWVSEIMLQQTRVEAVKGYYDRFLTRLPDVKALAEAEEEVLLKLWEGLGYYNRVRNMQKAARVLTKQYGGEMPADYEAIRALPGIGDYTAGAIASIAFGLPYPAVDGNVLRVMSRVACNEEDIAKEQTKRKLKEDLTAIMPAQSGDFNQSLMELGATVCLPNGKPLCEQCPVMHLCKAFHAGRETELPIKSGKKERRIENRLVYLVCQDGKVLIHRRAKKGLLAGLWEFPNVLAEQEKITEEGTLLQEILRQYITEEAEGKVKKGKNAKHIFSHVEWHMKGIWIEADEAVSVQTDESWRFVTTQELKDTYAIPSAFEAYLREVLEKY